MATAPLTATSTPTNVLTPTSPPTRTATTAPTTASTHTPGPPTATISVPPATATSAGPTVTRTPAPLAGNYGEFVALCGLSHRGPNDPIVGPGVAGGSHYHDFFGATTTDHNSTLASLLASPTTCLPGEDTSAYWVPTLYPASGQAVGYNVTSTATATSHV